MALVVVSASNHWLSWLVAAGLRCHCFAVLVGAMVALCAPRLARASDDPVAALVGRHESASALIHYQPADEALAHRVGEILDFAREAIGARYGQVPGKIRVYIYDSDAAMATGVKHMLNYGDDAVTAVVHVGVTQVENGTFHMHRRVASWGDRLWHAGVDEYVQGVTAATFGMAPAQSATWLDEGLSSYLAYETLKERLPNYETEFFEFTRKAAFKALVLGRLPQLAEVSDRTRWFASIKKSVDAWRNEYAKADVSVFYIIDNYGLNTLLALLGDVRDGLHYTAAIRRQLALTPEELEADIHRSLFFIGIFELYWRYVAAFIMVSVLGTVLLVRWRGRSSVSSVGK